MRLLFVGAALAACIASASYAASENAISPDQTMSKMGECMTVEGQVSLGPSKGRFGADLSFAGNSRFIGYVPMTDSLGDLARYDGRTVDLTGVIEPGRYSPAEIQITSPEQLMMADETPDHLLTCDHF